MMKIKGVLDGFSSKVTPAAKPEEEIAETLRSDNFQIAKTFLYGFPYQPTALAFDPVQRLLAIGTKTGSLRILGRPGVDTQVRHENEVAVIQIDFLMNEGALITATSDDSLHLWNFRQKRPEIVHSLKFQKERITYMNLPVGSKWLYVGTERGNVHVINVESFTLSGYIINWNKAIDVLRPTHPGPVVHLSDCPTDANKLLIGYESGQIVLWNLRTKKADIRWQSSESLKSISWHFEGKQFICAHSDGSLTTWALRPQEKPTSTIAPHSKLNKEGKVDPPCKAIQKVEWKISKAGDTYIIFSGGTSYESAGRNPNITIMYKKAVTVVEMEHNIVDFITLCESPYVTEMQDPYAIVVLLQNDLVVLDLNTPEFPCFENPYPMDIHESPVTYCSYIADCPSDIIPAFYSVGSRATQKRAHYYSTKEWPISGGEPSPTSCCSYNEIIITGHNDGSVKFWDASAGNLQILYKLKTAKVFEKQKSRSTDGNEDDPFSVQLISLCPESRKLAVAGASGYVIMFKFRKLESTSDIPVIKIPSNSGYADQEPELSPDYDSASRRSEGSQRSSVLEYSYPVRVKSGPQKKPPGFQPHLVCLTAFSLPSEPMFQITALAINSSYGLLAYGSENGVVIVDFIRKCCLWNVSSCDLYGNSDPFQRSVRSPKRNTASAEASDGERCRSPSIDQDVETEENGRKHTLDKLDSTFSRSRSSSMSSLENITSEAIQCLVFADSFNKKSDSVTTPMLWIGTSVGSVFNVLANIPPSGESRLNQPATISAVCMLDGPVVRLKGGILTISFLDYNGSLIRYAYEQWKDETRDKRTPTKGTNNPTNSSLNSSVESVNNANSANQNCDKQYMVVVSEKQARVIALPSHDCIFKQQLADTDFVVKAQVILYQDSVCLLCYLSNSHITAYGLPSLRPLIDVEFLPLSDLSFQTRKQGIVDPMLSIWGQQMFVNEDTNQISKTFCFSSRGHGLYFASPSEIQKFTISAKFCEEMSEMVSELFVARDMPEAPKQSLFKSLLAGVPRSVDREELFGESSGKPAGSVAKHIPGPSTQVEQLSLRANTAAGEVSKAHHLMVERGEKLGQLEERTQRMMSESEKFASSAHDLLQKTKEKKWYQL